jgi:nitrogenase molybdenum-iron protein beta chain
MLPLPIGVSNTDDYITALSHFSSNEVPYALEEERGQLIDIMLDANQYYYKKSVAVYGDPDTVLGLTSLALELGMIPKYVLTGTPKADFVRYAEALFSKFGVEGCRAKDAGDLFELHQWIKNDPVDLLLGNSHGKQIARAENIPLVRAGFPVIDRYVHSYMPIVGYKGAMRLIEMILSALMDRQDRDCAEEEFEMVM